MGRDEVMGGSEGEVYARDRATKDDIRRLLFQEYRTAHDVPDHVLHAVAVGFQFEPVSLQESELVVGQAAAGRVGREMFKHAEGDLVDAVFGQVTLQVDDAADLGRVGQRRTGIDRLPL